MLKASVVLPARIIGRFYMKTRLLIATDLQIIWTLCKSERLTLYWHRYALPSVRFVLPLIYSTQGQIVLIHACLKATFFEKLISSFFLLQLRRFSNIVVLLLFTQTFIYSAISFFLRSVSTMSFCSSPVENLSPFFVYLSRFGFFQFGEIVSIFHFRREVGFII